VKSEYSANLALQTRHRGRQVLAPTRRLSWLTQFVLALLNR